MYRIMSNLVLCVSRCVIFEGRQFIDPFLKTRQTARCDEVDTDSVKVSFDGLNKNRTSTLQVQKNILS